MMLSSKLKLKADEIVDRLIDNMSDALQRRERLDEVETSLFRGLLELGRELLQGAVDGIVAQEEENAAASVPGVDGVALQKIERQPRRLVTVFGALHIDGPVYAVRQKQKIQRAPVNERLGLPAGEFSYLVEDWGTRGVLIMDAICSSGSKTGLVVDQTINPRLRSGWSSRTRSRKRRTVCTSCWGCRCQSAVSKA